MIEAVVDAVFQYASAETLDALATEIRTKSKDDKAGKQSEYISAIFAARASAPAPGAADLSKLTDEQLAAELKRREEAKKAGKGTKDVSAV